VLVGRYDRVVIAPQQLGEQGRKRRIESMV